MGIFQSTRKCPRCGVELLESNMVEHTRECVKTSGSGKADGSWDFNYAGPSSGIAQAGTAIAATNRGAIEHKK